MIFGKTGFRCKLVKAYFSAKAGTEDIHCAGKAFVEFDARGLPDRRQIVYRFGDATVLLQMIRQQGSHLLFKPEFVMPFFLMRSQDRPDQGIEGRIPMVQLVEERNRGQLFFSARVQDPVCRSYQGIKNGFAEEFPEMNVKSFGTAGIFFDLEGIRLGAITDKIAFLVDAGSLPVHAAKAIAPYIQKKRKGSFDIGAETVPHLRMNDDTGKTFGIQRKVAPSQPIAKSLGYLALQPGKIGKFM
jgi:hypothetical protein